MDRIGRKAKRWLRLPRGRPLQRVWQVLRDIAIVALAYVAALALRFDGEPPRESWQIFAAVIPGIAFLYIASNYVFGIYRTAWQYGGIPDILNLGRAVGVATAIIVLVNLFVPERDVPLSVNLAAGLFAFVGMGGSKLWARISRGAWGNRVEPGRRVLIAGAGNTGQLIAREFREHPGWAYHPVAFVDDDPRKQGIRVHGIPVVGRTTELPAVVRDHEIELVAIALPGSSGDVIRGVIDTCQALNTQVRMVPSLHEIVRGLAHPSDLREVTVEDLLSRDPVEIDYSLCSQEIRGKAVLITGAAGSIGSELARQVLALEPLALLLFDNNESAVHDLHLALTATDSETSVRAIVGDITDDRKVDAVFDAARPQLVFHAAAYKHVPLMEEYPEEAFRVNVLGTTNVFDAAAKYGAGKVVFVSSDKAVNPTSVLGVTKRLGELLVMARGGASETVFCAVRFGNVMGSRGSVVPTFWSQIERGGPVSITDPDAMRYFLTVPEAVSLVIEAAAFATQGQIYVLDMGDEIRIVQLAEKMIRMRGLRPHEDVRITYTGLRPGEKLREELVARGEWTVPTRQPKILAVEGGVAPTPASLASAIERVREGSPEAPQLVAQLHSIVDSGLYPALPPVRDEEGHPSQ